uniref:Nucleolus and neural progenitor protein-like N-terminal domain-containing protein n=2 Tax=Aegilops tauschii subsp. strangulata TaxID=200361 RepID=A0A453KZ97_AEGTS
RCPVLRLPPPFTGALCPPRRPARSAPDGSHNCDLPPFPGPSAARLRAGHFWPHPPCRLVPGLPPCFRRPGADARRRGAPDMAATKPGAAAMAQCQEGSAEEHRLRAALRHLQAEAGVLERLVYKHRNQHRGAAYFQYLLKVRRDLKLLLGANLMEVINAVFPVITCRKPANTILATNRQGKRKPGANHSHYKRLLGVARLLSQMAEPVMKGAVYPFFVVLLFS